MEKSKVYFTKNISSENLIRIYDILEKDLNGKVAIKISTGEPGGHNFLKSYLIKDLVKKLNGTIVECNTAYHGERYESSDHWEVIKKHGFNDIAPCDILDEYDEKEIPINNSVHLKGKNIVGKNIEKYDSILMLSHFKGHQMGGFGGALKNMSIGLASRNGKAWIHSWGNTSDTEKMWDYTGNQDAFLESMAEACSGVIDYMHSNIVYINVANNLSIDCDCNNNPTPPEMDDIGIFASIDPVALDKCCYDTVINSKDIGKDSLINRMKEKNAIHLVDTAELLGLGTTNYELIDIDEGEYI